MSGADSGASAPAPRQTPFTGPPAIKAVAPPPSPADTPPPPPSSQPARQDRIALIDLLDRVLAGGVVLTGEVRLSIADVDMVTISLQALISSVRTGLPHPTGAGDGRP